MPGFSEIQNIEGATSENSFMEWPSIDGEVTTDIEVTGFISVDGDVSGELTPDPEVVGYVSYEGADISGSIETVAHITGYIEMPLSEAAEIYNGATRIKPSTQDNIVLATQNKQVISNIVVEKIFYAAVTNLSGGYTVTIGE